MTDTLPDDARWRAVRTRDPEADGRFVYAVLTTGVYCRPSCSARTPRVENVVFHPDPAAAERAGFRACKRCTPDGPSPAAKRSALVEAACRHIDACEEPPTLAALAAHLGHSPSHVRRVFKAVTGVTPRAWASARRAARVRRALDARATVTEAILEAGYGAVSRFYEAADDVLGMTPTAWRDGGAGETVRVCTRPCALGHALIAATARGICAVALGSDPAALRADFDARLPRVTVVEGDPPFEALVAAVLARIDDPVAGRALPLDIRGTAFQHRVWQALRRIPAGRTASYGEVARRLGQPDAARAVAGACAANTVAVLVPCHRVVRGDGAPGGYRWGVERKRALLAREAEPDRG